MTRKLENLDSETLDRISGGCRQVAQSAQKPGAALAMTNKLGSLMDFATMPANFADIREAAMPMIQDLIPAADQALPVIQDLIPAAHDLIGNVDLPQVLDSTQLGSGLPDLDLQGISSLDGLQDLPDLPDNWCGTPDQGWDDMDDATPAADAPGADDAGGQILATDGHAFTDWSPLMGHAVAEQIAPPTVRDHRVAAAEPEAVSAVIHDHRTAASDAASDVHQPIVRDQR